MSDEGDLNRRTRRELATRGSETHVSNMIEQALSALTPLQKEALVERAAIEGLKLEVERLKVDAEYAVGRKVAEDHVDTFAMIDKSGRTTRQTVKSVIATGAGKMTIESKSGPTCFVATAAYGNQEHPDVVSLRRFRDDILVHYWAGRLFIDLYWRFGPIMATHVTPRPRLRRATRGAIKALLFSLKRLGLVRSRWQR